MHAPSPNTQHHAKLADRLLACHEGVFSGLRQQLQRYNITLTQLDLLMHMSSSREMTMSNIAGKMDLSGAAVTGLVDRCIYLGYIERFYDPADRRKVMARITIQGLDLVIRLRDELRGKIISALNKADTIQEAA